MGNDQEQLQDAINNLVTAAIDAGMSLDEALGTMEVVRDLVTDDHGEDDEDDEDDEGGEAGPVGAVGDGDIYDAYSRERHQEEGDG